MNAKRKLELLVVDDDPRVREAVRLLLEDEGHAVILAEDGDAALAAVTEGRFDAALLDVNMPRLNGLVAMTRMAEIDPALSMIILTGESAIQTAREAILKVGAFDLIAKPPDATHLLGVVEEAARLTGLRRTATTANGGGADAGMVGESAAMRALLEQVQKVAPSQGRVLISGENGSGKELVAHAIHRLSKRAAGPFVKINCAAIPRDLVESELFGYERGAFSGAVQAKKGRLELADGGTLFLDEIGDLSLEAQAKLLRVIETGEVERVGGTRTQHVDVRIVAATNKNLTAAIEAGDFREDLFYRLNVLPLHVAPLRERRGDIPLLAAHFLEACCAAEGRPVKRLGAEAERLLASYHWPGNVRELRNLMERAAILVPGTEIRAEDLAPWLESAAERDEAVGLRGEIERREADAVRKALESANWNVTQAAAGLGIDRTNLHRKMRKYGIARR
jgi:two-component system nitrogen regulation response regulator NtrX